MGAEGPSDWSHLVLAVLSGVSEVAAVPTCADGSIACSAGLTGVWGGHGLPGTGSGSTCDGHRWAQGNEFFKSDLVLSSHFVNEETDTQRASNVPKVT